MAPAAITAPPIRKGFRCSSESVPEALSPAADSASAAPSWDGVGFSGSGAAGAGSDLGGAAGSFFSALDAALGAEAPALALASMDSGTQVWYAQEESLKVSFLLLH
ncbi:hypothetical protein ATANTOWER_023682 [Ataeniobius toweri]|uniref:Uncharacterized protein n=1 Tax=Ataeniobius toweri TaxID=208326 RepID=A0ABU7C1K2_9TELE|nr:hypothetical protein [Ataeniobius toweri]